MDYLALIKLWPEEAVEKIRCAHELIREAAAKAPAGETRLEILRAGIDAVLLKMEDKVERRCGYLHLYGVAQAAAMLAEIRGEDPELAAMAGMLHDFYSYTTGDIPDHAHKGAPFAWQVLTGLNLVSENEREMICRAIYDHSDKGERHLPFSEVLTDADVLQHVLYNPSFPVKAHEKARFEALCGELGMNR